MANWRHPEKNRPRRVTREVAAPMMNMTTPLNPAPTQTAVASLMNRKGSSGTAAPAAKSRNDVPPAIQAEPPRPSGSMPSFSRATTSRATRRLLKRPSTTRPAWRSLRPFSSKLPASSRFSFCGARWIARDSAATCASLNSRDVLTESHSPMAIEQAPAMSPARPDTSNACAEIPAPKTPATRLRLETRPSLAPSTAARRALPPPAVSSFFFFALLGMAIVIALASGAWASQAPRMYRRGQHGEDRENRRGMANGIDPRAVPHRTPEGHRAGFHRGILGQQIARHVCLRLLRPTALFRRHQIRFRHRLTELLQALGALACAAFEDLERRGEPGERDPALDQIGRAVEPGRRLAGHHLDRMNPALGGRPHGIEPDERAGWDDDARALFPGALDQIEMPQ